LRDSGSLAEVRAEAVLRRMIPHGSMLAYTRVFEHQGRSYVLSTDGSIVPADRVRPYRESAYRGVELGGSLKLPIAFVRQKPRPRWLRSADGSFAAAPGRWPAKSALAIAPGGAVIEHARRRYLQTLERDAQGRAVYILEDDATVVVARDGAAFGARKGEKWIIVSITRGTLVAYDGERPVYATLISPGAGGVPVPGRDPVKWSTTPLGVFRVTFKHRAATMSPEAVEAKRSFWIADVPWTQYFQAPFALHTAYWHEDFGEPMSAGCVNLSPHDGRWLFEFTDPELPDGWNGVAAGRDNGLGTRIVIVR
jgi:lipoprotein-anchoring transpeptidase ErfK/SrfK